MPWYAIEVDYRAAWKGEEQLKKLGFGLLIPHTEEPYRWHGREHETHKKPVLPGYGFVEAEIDQPLYTLSRCWGVEGVLHDLESPRPIPQDSMDRMQAKIGYDEQGRVEPQVLPEEFRHLTPGEAAIIVHGHLAGRRAVIRRHRGERVNATVDSMPVELPRSAFGP